jgi:predicted dehydrogenase
VSGERVSGERVSGERVSGERVSGERVSAGERLPRLGFVGLGWIGAMRLQAVAAAGAARVVALCDADATRLDDAARAHPGARRYAGYESMLAAAEELALDGVVIATPNALHAPQAHAALERGLAVFCQKPLALTAPSARALVAAARRADRLLAVDYTYRHTDGMTELARLAAAGEFGRIFSVDAVFHNAYGPDKAWCLDPALAGGGALVDLGVHLIDLALRVLGAPPLRDVRGSVLRGGVPLPPGPGIDDFAALALRTDDGARAHLTASWNAQIGRDAEIRFTVLGTAGGAAFRNRNGSFYDFELLRFDGRSRSTVLAESREWLARGILAWAARVARDSGYDAGIEATIATAAVIDAVYGPLNPG